MIKNDIYLPDICIKIKSGKIILIDAEDLAAVNYGKCLYFLNNGFILFNKTKK